MPKYMTQRVVLEITVDLARHEPPSKWDFYSMLDTDGTTCSLHSVEATTIETNQEAVADMENDPYMEK